MNTNTPSKIRKSEPAEGDLGELWRRLRQSIAQPGSWLALARTYCCLNLPWQAGYAARQALRLDANLLHQLNALSIVDWQVPSKGDALLGRDKLANAAELADRFQSHLNTFPGDWLSWLYVTRLHEMLTTDEMAATSLLQPPNPCVQAQQLEPLPGESLHWLGVWRLNAGQSASAVAALSQLLEIRPVRHGSMMYLGEALMQLGNTAAAEKAYVRASTSNNPDFLRTLAAKVFAQNYWMQAKELLQRALSLRPGDVSVLTALAKIHWDVYELSEAQNRCRAILKIDPGNQDAAYMMAAMPGRMGDAKGNLEALQAEYSAAGNTGSRLASSIAMASLYQDDMSAAEVADLHRSLCAPIEEAVASSNGHYKDVSTRLHGLSAGSKTASPRRLRVGFVTGDLHRQHPVNIFMLPILQRFDLNTFEVCVYYTGTMYDNYTRLAKECTSRWLEAAPLDDAALREAIIHDEIDILVDLAGHTASHRLGVFAMRAAPVQATFLGYPHSTGLTQIDWLVGDATVSPAEHAHLFSEGLAQLPESVFCWAPEDSYALPPARPASAPVVFGSFNNAMKLSPKTVQLWARVLKAVPDSQLLLKAPSLRDASVRARFSARFAEQGIAQERLIFRGPSGLADMMQEYGDIDIALDPTPYNGGTTTMQALWMGVPVVCLNGNNFVSRMGASFLKALKQADWLANDENAYVAAASRLADQCAEGGQLRSSRTLLREQMAVSPLCDIATYVKNFEALLHAMWNAHIGADSSRRIACDSYKR